MGLERLISDDSRTPIEKLRRKQLWDIADAYDLPYPSAAPKTVMIPIIESAGIDVTRPLPTGEKLVQEIQVEDEDGKVHTDFAPVEKPHATQNKQIDYNAVIEAKAKAAESQDELKEAKDEIARMREKLAELEAGEKSFSDMKMPELRKAAKESGINSFGLSKKDIIEKLENGDNR